MVKCSITKYLAKVDNLSLPKLGILEIPITAKRYFCFISDKDGTLSVINGHLEKTDGTNIGSSISVKANTNTATQMAYVVPDKDGCIVTTDCLYGIIWLNAADIKEHEFTTKEWDSFIVRLKRNKRIRCIAFSPSIESFMSLTALTNIELYNTNISGDISAFKNCTALTNIALFNTNISGDISAFKNCTALTSIALYNTNISGDISAFKNCTALTNIELYKTNVSGDISAFKNCTALTTLSIGTTMISGDISSLKDTKITNFRMPNTQVSGNIATLADIEGLQFLRLGGTKVTGDATDLVTKATNLHLLEIPTAVNITDEQKQTLTSRGCTITITDNAI